MERLELTVAEAGHRLDRFLAEQRHDQSRVFFQRLIADGFVAVNGQPAKPSARLRVGDRVVVCIPPPAPTELRPEPMPLAVVYEDADIVVVDKPAGLVVHPGAGHPTQTLANALLAQFPELGSIDATLRPGIVHRLDKDTSGLMVVAKTKAAQLRLTEAIKERRVLKRYLTLVVGRPDPQAGVIDAAIGRHPTQRKRMAVVPWGRPARSHYRLLRHFPGDGRGYSLVEVTLETGRTHQIRVHCQSIGHPVVGDAVYGVKAPFVSRQFLHAAVLGLHLPGSGEYREFASPLPADLRAALRAVAGDAESGTVASEAGFG